MVGQHKLRAFAGTDFRELGLRQRDGVVGRVEHELVVLAAVQPFAVLDNEPLAVLALRSQLGQQLAGTFIISWAGQQRFADFRHVEPVKYHSVT